MDCYIGIDIGGTNIRIGTIYINGKLENFIIKPSQYLNTEKAADLLVEDLSSYITKHKLKDKIKGITIGVPSSVSKDKTKILSTPNLKGLDNINLVEKIEETLETKVYLDRDVNFLLMNDIETHNLEKGKDETIIGMYLGTGFGNAIYINGNLYSGKNGVAGELGHIPLYGVDATCSCGNTGCTETKVSGKYLANLRDEKFPDTHMDDLFIKHKDDEEIIRFVDDTAVVIATEINILDPDYVILAGGVISMPGFPKDLLVEKIKGRLRKPYPYENINMIFATHEQESGVRGALPYIKKIENKN